MYAFNKQVHQPTGIEHALYCNFLSGNRKHLITAGVNHIWVYNLLHDVEVTSKASDKQGDVKVKKQKLELVLSSTLWGNIVSMKSVRQAGSTRDSLLLSFQDAQMCMIEYDPAVHDVKTSSMHYFEEEHLKHGRIQHSYNLPMVRVDPEGRCAAMHIYGSSLVILPFRRDTGQDDAEASDSSSRTPVLSSYLIELSKLDENVTSLIDFQFLFGYYEPTIFILYEPLPTWSGRIAVRKDSCNIVAISLSLQERTHPIIWSLSGLPYDCSQVLPVPKPIGGVLIFAANALLYLNQSVPPYGVSLNQSASIGTDFLLKNQENLKMSLDCAQAAFIDYDTMVISLKGGELYVLTLVIDGMRSVRSFNFEKAAASVLTTSVTLCEEGFLFLGSRLGNSLLLKYLAKAGESVPPTTEHNEDDQNDEAEPPDKKKKSDEMGEWMASDVNQMDDMDEVEVYGSEATTGTSQITSYIFEVCDSIMNIGPCSETVMGEPAFLSEEFGQSTDPDLELVTTSGYGKNGALSVLQRSIRPQVVTTFELPGCHDMWTLVGKELSGQEDQDKSHTYLILSRDDSSMVLQTGQEIMELDHSGFNTTSRTIIAGNVGKDKYIVQVTENDIKLLNDAAAELQVVAVDSATPLVSGHICDPYIIAINNQGEILVLQLEDTSGGEPKLITLRCSIHMNSPILAACIYHDVSGIFTTENISAPEAPASFQPQIVPELNKASEKTTIEDEEELLYGDSEPTTKTNPEETTTTTSTEPTEPVALDTKPTYWLVLSREDGTLEIYQAEGNFTLSFECRSFPMGNKVLVDVGQLSQLDSEACIKPTGNRDDMPVINELLMIGLGHKKHRPHLLARAGDDLYVYEAFQYQVSSGEDILNVRFKKIQHGLILKERKAAGRLRKDDDEEKKDGFKPRMLRPFEDISGYSGVFICGPYPHWIFMSVRGALRIHPMNIDGWVSSFAPFHNVNCPKGFLYFNKQGELRISVLPTHLSYDALWPIRKVALRCTPHHVIYHPESKTYCVMSSTPELVKKLVRVQGEGDKEFDEQEREENFIFPTMERFSIQLLSPVSWDTIPNTKYELEEFEHATCMKIVNLTTEGTVSGLKGYIAVGTNNCYGEDVTSRGRILIYEIIEVVPEPGQPLTKNKMKVIYDKEQKGPVTALESVSGHLVSALGQKIYIWELKDNDLMGVAFIDTQVYATYMTSVKNMLLVGDLMKSVSLLRYQEDMKVLSLVSRDIRPLEIYAGAFVVDSTNLCFLASDKEKNLILYAYQPEVRESFSGTRLLRRADFNIGSNTSTFFRIRCRLTDPSTGKRLHVTYKHKHVNFYATLDGSIGYVLPISEKMYRRLLMVQNALTSHIPHLGGLNPKNYRHVKMAIKSLTNPSRSIVDGDLLWCYLHLSQPEKSEMARRIGSTKEQILDDLMELDRITSHF